MSDVRLVLDPNHAEAGIAAARTSRGQTPRPGRQWCVSTSLFDPFGRCVVCGPERVRHMSSEAARLGEADPDAALVSL